jgi:hypothetical protein
MKEPKLQPMECPRREGVLTPEEKEVQEKFQRELETYLSEGEGSYVKKIITLAERKNIPLDFSRPEFISAYQKGLENCLLKGRIFDADEIIVLAEEKKIPLAHLTSACQKGLENCLLSGEIFNAKAIITFVEEKKIPLDLTSACQKGLEACLSGGRISDAKEIIVLAEEKKIPLAHLTSACQKGLENCLLKGRIFAEEIITFTEKKNIHLNLTSACQKGLESYLSQGWFSDAEEIITFAEEKNISLDLAPPFSQSALKMFQEKNDLLFELLALGEKYKVSLEKVPELRDAIEFFREYGRFISFSFFDVYNLLAKNQPPSPELQALGIKKTGKEGLNQLRQFYEKFRHFVLEPKNEEKLLELFQYSLPQELFKNFVRFKTSKWARDYDFEGLVKQYLQSKKEGKIAPLPEEYLAFPESLKLRVDYLDERKEFILQEGAVRRYQTLRADIPTKEILVNEKDFLIKEKKELSQIINQRKKEIEEKLPTLKEKARSFQEKEFAVLNELGLKIEGAEDVQRVFSLLTSFPYKKDIFESSIRRLLFFLSLKENPNQKTQEDFPHSPDLLALDEMTEFVNHSVKEETLKKIPLTQEQKKEISKSLNVKALTEERQRAEKSLKVTGKKEIEIIPNRSLLGEFAGYYSDACYTIETNILRDHPNLDVLTFVLNRGTADERLAGATLILRTEDTEGRDLMIVRALNPLENVLAEISAESFVEELFAYLKKVAKKRGSKLAVVIDHQGGASTNRGKIFDFLSSKYKEKRVALKNPKEVYFNEYDLSEVTYLVK